MEQLERELSPAKQASNFIKAKRIGLRLFLKFDVTEILHMDLSLPGPFLTLIPCHGMVRKVLFLNKRG